MEVQYPCLQSISHICLAHHFAGATDGALPSPSSLPAQVDISYILPSESFSTCLFI